MVLDRIDRIRGEWMMNSLLNIVGTIDWGNFAVVAFLLAVPTVFCLLIWLKSPLVKSIGRLLATMVCQRCVRGLVCPRLGGAEVEV